MPGEASVTWTQIFRAASRLLRITRSMPPGTCSTAYSTAGVEPCRFGAGRVAVELDGAGAEPDKRRAVFFIKSCVCHASALHESDSAAAEMAGVKSRAN